MTNPQSSVETLHIVPAYAVIKGLNFKAREMAKLKDTNDALMLKIERDNRKPWDKHDCA